jgi:hypothetical protein
VDVQVQNLIYTVPEYVVRAVAIIPPYYFQLLSRLVFALLDSIMSRRS